MKNYSKIFATLLLVVFLIPTIAGAENVKNTAAREQAAKTTENSQENNKAGDLKTRANKEIERRVATLNKLIIKVEKVKKLSADQKADIKSQIQQNISDLNALKIKIAGESDLEIIKTDVQTIKDSYKIYMLFVPKVHILSGAYTATTTVTKLETIYTKLETKIAEEKSAGNDVATLETTLEDMQAKITEAKTEIATAETKVMSLQPSGYPENKTALQEARTALWKAHNALMEAKKDGVKINNALKQINQTETETSE